MDHQGSNESGNKHNGGSFYLQRRKIKSCSWHRSKSNGRTSRITQKIKVVQNEGSRKVSRKVTFYSLDAIIAVGYRVDSKEATDFRIWATNTLKEYIKKGFVVNSEMLKNGPKFGKDYFDELVAKIKEIRASERRFYQKITDIYKECSFDYDKARNIFKYKRI